MRKITAEEFARRLKVTSSQPDKRFAFFLGAGCSVSSGIPSAGDLVSQCWLPRLRDIRAPHWNDLNAWAKEEFLTYDPKNPAAFYGDVMEKLFLQPEERQLEVEALCEGRFPGFGYAVLSSLMALEGGRSNIALTTNFDDLLADALYLFTQARPLVIHHESLANYIRPTRTRPLVVKLHGDNRLSPQNTTEETRSLKKEIEQQVRTVLHDRGLIFIGYGGNDNGIRRMLEALPQEGLPLGVFWVSAREAQGIIRPWLAARNAVWVHKGDFDELMLLVRDAFELAHPDGTRFKALFEQYTDTYNALSSRIKSLPDTAPGAPALKEAVERTDRSFSGWSAVELAARSVEKVNPDQADAIYTEGLKQFPKSAYLLSAYAIFLARVRRDYDRAKKLFTIAMSLASDSPKIRCEYASFLAHDLENDRGAERIYIRTMHAMPRDPTIRASYAGFLLGRGRVEKGLRVLERVLQRRDVSEPSGLAVECWVYALVHGPAERRSLALRKLKRALEAGKRCPTLVLSPNIDQARRCENPCVIWFEKLAAVISGEAELSTLDSWPEWKQARL